MAQIVNIGDKVRFLNDVGGGIVTGFRNGGLVLVEDEDGFEIPVLAQEVVVIAPANAAPEPTPAPVMVQKEVARPKKEKEEEPTEEDIRIAQLKELYKKEQQSAAPKAVASSSATASATSSATTATTADSARIPAATKPHSTRNPNDEYVSSLEERVLKLEMTVKRLQMRLERLEDAKALREKMKSENQERREAQRKKQTDGILEIDLHAHEILETTAGMSPADIRDYQVNYFKKIMEEHKTDKGMKIVFIHGNGEGVLRNKITTELKRLYKSCDYQDASFQQYGFGATMVTIH